MKRILLLLLLLIPTLVFSQEEKWNWWNDLHGWKPGMPCWKRFLIISPGYLGPNALPVPEVKKGVVGTEKKLELGTDLHFKSGDNTQNISGSFFYPFLDGKIAIEVWGVLLERYNMCDSIRDMRFARDKNGTGMASGDLYFSTLVQIVKNRKFPDTMLRMACKTASGNRFDAARYSDNPGYFFDLSFSKNLSNPERNVQFVPFWSGGFYSWQTNDDFIFQDDAFMYGAGFDCRIADKWTISNSASGYIGYKNNGDRPSVYTLDIQKKIKDKTIRLQYLYGIRDWTYQTVKLSMIWRL